MGSSANCHTAMSAPQTRNDIASAPPTSWARNQSQSNAGASSQTVQPARAGGLPSFRVIQFDGADRCSPRPSSSFAVGVSQVALGLACGLILNHTRDAVSVHRVARIGPGACRCRDCSFPICSFCLSALPLLGLAPLPRGAPLCTGCSNRLTFCLPRKLGRFGCFLCSTKCLQASSCCLGSGPATIRKITVPGIFQIFTPVEVSARRKLGYQARFEMAATPVANSFANRASRRRVVFSSRTSRSESRSATTRWRAANCDWALPKAISARWRGLLCVWAMFVLTSQQLSSVSRNRKGQANCLTWSR